MTPYYSEAGIEIFHGDCRDVLDSYTDLRVNRQAFDLLLTDPPYGISAAKKGAHSSIRDDKRWPTSNWDDTPNPVGVQIARSLCRFQMVWGGNYYDLPPSPAWLAWVKPEAGTGFSLADMELCWTNGAFAARVKHLQRRDGNLHPTQKPEALMIWCLGFFDGPRVLDPFMGSGTTLVAAKRLGRSAVGIDINEAYCEMAAERLRQGALPLEMGA